MNQTDQSPPASPAPRRRSPWTLLLLLLLGGTGYYAWTQHGQVAAQAEQLAALTAARDEAVAEAERRQAAVGEAEKQRAALEAGRVELEAQLQAARAEVQSLQAAAAAVPVPAPAAMPEPAAGPPPAPVEPPTVAPPTVTAEPTAKPAPPQTLTITFDVNSSYFPASLNGRLRRLATGLEPGRAYAVQLTGSIGTDPVENGGPADAAAYNRWIAERRLDRVADFLQATADGADLSIERSFARKDSSRRVVVSIRPILP